MTDVKAKSKVFKVTCTEGPWQTAPNMDPARRRGAQKWRSTVATVEWLLSQLAGDRQFQLYSFNTSAWPLLKDSAGKWLAASDAASSMAMTMPKRASRRA